MLVTAAWSLGWLGSFCQVHSPAAPSVCSCSLRLIFWQSLCWKKSKQTNKQINNTTIFRKEKLQMIKKKIINKHINHASLTLSSS